MVPKTRLWSKSKWKSKFDITTSWITSMFEKTFDLTILSCPAHQKHYSLQNPDPSNGDWDLAMNRIPRVSVAALQPPTNCKKQLQNSATSQKCLCKQTPRMATCMTWHQHLVNHPQAFADGTFSRGPQAHWEEREGEEEKGVTKEKMTRVTEVLEPHKMLQMLSSTMVIITETLM